MTGPAAQPSLEPCFRIRTPDRLQVDLAEYRRGYCYSVRMRMHCTAGIPRVPAPTGRHDASLVVCQHVVVSETWPTLIVVVLPCEPACGLRQPT